MTPNNIVNMAALKGLDVIAVADHNSALNLPAVASIARQVGVCLIPAIEFNTREEVHILGYFPTVDTALEISDRVRSFLLLDNKPDFFGEQKVLNDRDEEVAVEQKLLIQALDLSIDQLDDWINDMGGLAVPAHINRGSNGILKVLGFLPPGANYDALEVAKKGDPVNQRLLDSHRILHSSDAHRLEDILEREQFLEMESKTVTAFFDSMKRKL